MEFKGFEKIKQWRKEKRLARIQTQSERQSINPLLNTGLLSVQVAAAAIAFSSAVFSVYSEKSGYKEQVTQGLAFPYHAYSAVTETASLVSSVIQNSQTSENGEEVGIIEGWKRKWNIGKDVGEYTGGEVKKSISFLLRAKENLSHSLLQSILAGLSVFSIYGALSYFIYTLRKGDGDSFSHKLRKKLARRYGYRNSELDLDTIEQIEETLQLKINPEEARRLLLEIILHISEEEAATILKDAETSQKPKISHPENLS